MDMLQILSGLVFMHLQLLLWEAVYFAKFYI